MLKLIGSVMVLRLMRARLSARQKSAAQSGGGRRHAACARSYPQRDFWKTDTYAGNCRSADGKRALIIRKVFRTLQRRLREQNGLSLGYLWRSTLRDCRAQVGLGTQECDILCDAANYLGRYDADEQLTGLSQVERRLVVSREAAQEDLANRGNLYRTCGIALGLLVILVLI